MLILLLACSESSSDDPTDGTDAVDTSESSSVSSGCGVATNQPAGGVQLALDAGAAGDGERTYWLSLPPDYDPDTPHTLTIGYAGTNWTGEQIQPYLGLEDGSQAAEIYVYPDPLWRAFEGWGTYGGWVLGESAQPADGMGDLNFTAALLDALEATYCIDTDRVFVTGHSWGGDMAQVTSCFLGDRITASVPVAANRPYWFEESSGWSTCIGDTAVWTMFGINDDHFTWQDYPGQYGDECRDFWLEERACGTETTDLGYGAVEECIRYSGCSSEVRYCLYGPQTGHQIPSYFSEAALSYFRSF